MLSSWSICIASSRIAGLDHSIEAIMDRGHCLGFNEIESMPLSYLTSIIPHEHMNKVYRLPLWRSL